MSIELRKVESLFGCLRKQPIISFPAPRGTLEASDRLGIYLIISPSGKVLHVGRTPRAKYGICQRLYDHLYGRSSFVYYYLAKKGYLLRNGYKYQYLVVQNARLRALLEAYATAHLCPIHLGLGNN